MQWVGGASWMLKKSLSVLSGSLILASISQATYAIPFSPGDNAVLVFTTTGQGTFLQNTGVSADDIVREGKGFSINYLAAEAALGGTIEFFALLGRTSQTEPSIYNYSEFIYVDPGAGILLAGTGTGTALRNLTLQSTTAVLQRLLHIQEYGYQPEGALGDVNTFLPLINSLGGTLQPFQRAYEINVYHRYMTAEQNALAVSEIELDFFPQVALDSCSTGGPNGNWDDQGYDSLENCLTFNSGGKRDIDDAFRAESGWFRLYENDGAINPVPLPNASWLLMSALAGLGMSKRFASKSMASYSSPRKHQQFPFSQETMLSFCLTPLGQALTSWIRVFQRMR